MKIHLTRNNWIIASFVTVINEHENIQNMKSTPQNLSFKRCILWCTCVTKLIWLQQLKTYSVTYNKFYPGKIQKHLLFLFSLYMHTHSFRNELRQSTSWNRIFKQMFPHLSVKTRTPVISEGRPCYNTH